MKINLPSENNLAPQPEKDLRTARLEAAPESDRWNPVPGSPGHSAHTNASPEEDDGGRSANQQLVEAGVAQAELDQMAQARQAESKNK